MSPSLLPEEEDAMRQSPSTRWFFSQPNGVSDYVRPNCRASVDELPDPHFKVKQLAFRVASSSAHLPLEEPLLWRALDTNRDPYRSIRPAPVEEPHTVLPPFRKQQQANVCPGGDKPFACFSTGWLVANCLRRSTNGPSRTQRSLTICFVPPSIRSRNSFLSPRTE